MVKAILVAGLLFPAAAQAQVVTSYKSSNVALERGDDNKIVCKKEETIGSRLGAKKVCLTVAEWNALARENRERTERIQAGPCVVGEGQYCQEPF